MDGQNLLQPGFGPSGTTGFGAEFKFRVAAHSDPAAEGFAFVLQRQGLKALGAGGAGLGYAGIANSLAVKFDLVGPDGQPANRVGLYADGEMNDGGVETGLNFADGHEYKVSVDYNADTRCLALSVVQVVDATVAFSTTFTTADGPGDDDPALDLGQILGATDAYLGFTAATGPADAPPANAQFDINRFVFDPDRIPIEPWPGPKVTNVFVKGSSWNSAFLNWIGDVNDSNANGGAVGSPVYGYEVTAGERLPWANVNQISLQFDYDVGASFSTGDNKLIVRVRDASNTAGSTDKTVTATAIAYDAATKVVTYALPTNLELSKVLIALRDTDVIRNGELLDGDGNGVAGGNFNFRFDVIPGGVDRNGRVDAFDTLAARAKQGSNATTKPANYSLFHDIDGNGRIDAFDTLGIRAKQGGNILQVPGDLTAVTTFGAQRVTAADPASSEEGDDELAALLV